MANRHRVCESKRLHKCCQNLEPRSVIPKGKFNSFKMRAVGKTACIPSEGLWTVVVGVELVDCHPVMACSRKPDDQSRREYGHAGEEVGIDFGSDAVSSNYGAIQRVDFTGHGLRPRRVSSNMRDSSWLRLEGGWRFVGAVA